MSMVKHSVCGKHHLSLFFYVLRVNQRTIHIIHQHVVGHKVYHIIGKSVHTYGNPQIPGLNDKIKGSQLVVLWNAPTVIWR